MTEQEVPLGFIGEIRGFAAKFAPENWLLCDGKLLTIGGNPALYSIIGNRFGGDRKTTFAIPDLRRRIPIGAGNGPKLTPRKIGDKGGLERVPLTVDQLPPHNHNFRVSSETPVPPEKKDNNTLAAPEISIYNGETPNRELNESTISQTGFGIEHENMPPFLVFNWMICVAGFYPNRPPE